MLLSLFASVVRTFCEENVVFFLFVVVLVLAVVALCLLNNYFARKRPAGRDKVVHAGTRKDLVSIVYGVLINTLR